MSTAIICAVPVSYTHLDVYKRQDLRIVKPGDMVRLVPVKEAVECRVKVNGDAPVSYTHLIDNTFAEIPLRVGARFFFCCQTKEDYI